MKPRAYVVRALAAFLLLAAGALPLSAWNYKTCLGSLQRWSLAVQTFQVSNAWFPAGSGQRAALEAAVAAWNTTPSNPFVFVLQYRDDVFDNQIGDGRSTITFSFGGLGGAPAETFRPFYDCRTISEKDIVFDINQQWSWALNVSSPPRGTDRPLYFILAAMHELGHGMGLDHQSSQVSTMNWNYPCGGPVGNGNLVQPLADDLLGARIGYGPYGRPTWNFHDVYANTYRVESTVQTNPIPGPTIAYRGHPANFQFTLGNRGSVPEGSVRVQYYLSTDRFISTSDTYLGAATFSLGDGSWGTYTATATVPLGLTPGFYYFGTVVDPLGSIAESDENNNAVAVFSGTTVPDYSPPIPCMSASPTVGPAPLDVQLNGACSSDPDGFITTYRWNFGDGGQQEGSSPAVSHQYGSPGSYTVTLTVVDNMGFTSTTTQYIFVADPSGCLICG